MDKGKRESESEILERARRDMADQSTFPGGIPYDEQEIVDDGDVWIIKREKIKTIMVGRLTRKPVG